MPISSPTFKPSAITVLDAQNEKITNLPVGTSEVAHALTGTTKKIIIRNRGSSADLQIAFTVTESGTKYLTIPKRTTLSLSGLSFSSKTLYLQASLAAQTVEIMELY